VKYVFQVYQKIRYFNSITVTEEAIKKNSFEIILAIDDVISSGNRESTSIS